MRRILSHGMEVLCFFILGFPGEIGARDRADGARGPRPQSQLRLVPHVHAVPGHRVLRRPRRGPALRARDPSGRAPLPPSRPVAQARVSPVLPAAALRRCPVSPAASTGRSGARPGSSRARWDLERGAPSGVLHPGLQRSAGPGRERLGGGGVLPRAGARALAGHRPRQRLHGRHRRHRGRAGPRHRGSARHPLPGEGARPRPAACLPRFGGEMDRLHGRRSLDPPPCAAGGARAASRRAPISSSGRG